MDLTLPAAKRCAVVAPFDEPDGRWFRVVRGRRRPCVVSRGSQCLLPMAANTLGVGTVEWKTGEKLGRHAAALAGVELAAAGAGARRLRLTQFDEQIRGLPDVTEPAFISHVAGLEVVVEDERARVDVTDGIDSRSDFTTVTVLHCVNDSRESMVARWSMDEGAGSVALDSAKVGWAGPPARAESVELVYQDEPFLAPTPPGGVPPSAARREVTPLSSLGWVVWGSVNDGPRQMIGLLDYKSGRAAWDIRPVESA